MPEISRRGLQMPESPIRKLVPFAEEAKRKGRHVYHLNIGQPDIHTPLVGLEAVRHTSLQVIEYSHSAGIESYRKKQAEYYRRVGIHVDPSQIIVTCGGSEAIIFAMMTCLNPGDEVIIPEPFYANYNGFAVESGVVVKPITAHIEDGFALPKIEEFEKLITKKTKGIVICNPNNPTGYLYSQSEMEELREIILEHDLYLFSDEVYREFCYDGNTHYSAMNLQGVDDHVVMVDSISKRYSACGARVGTLVTRNKKILDTVLKFAQARLSPPTLGQIMGEASIDAPKAYFDEVYQEYIHRRDFVVEALNKMPGVFCPKPKGAFYVIVRLPVGDVDDFAKWLLTDFEHENQTVMLAPASGFYATPGLGRNEARVAYVLNLKDLEKAMMCLEEGLRLYPRKV